MHHVSLTYSTCYNDDLDKTGQSVQQNSRSTKETYIDDIPAASSASWFKNKVRRRPNSDLAINQLHMHGADNIMMNDPRRRGMLSTKSLRLTPDPFRCFVRPTCFVWGQFYQRITMGKVWVHKVSRYETRHQGNCHITSIYAHVPMKENNS